LSIDFTTKEGRKKYLTEKLDDLIEGINESYGSKLVEELLDRLEFTIEDFNNQMTDLHKMLVDKEKERRQMLDMISEDNSISLNQEVMTDNFTQKDSIGIPDQVDESELEPEPELTEWELRLKDLNGHTDIDKEKE